MVVKRTSELYVIGPISRGEIKIALPLLSLALQNPKGKKIQAEKNIVPVWVNCLTWTRQVTRDQGHIIKHSSSHCNLVV